MSLVWSLLACFAALAALVMVVVGERRTRKAIREQSREIVQLRHVIEARDLATPQSAEAPDEARGTDGRGWRDAYGLRLEQLEERLSDWMERGPLPVPQRPGSEGEMPASDLRDIVREGLRQQGYARVTVLDVTASGKVRVEVERDGVLGKGLARIDERGRVRLDAISSLRIFP
jgi:hypothetical protein